VNGDVNWPTVIAILVAILGGLGGVAALRKSGAEEAKVITDAAATTVGILRGEFDDLRHQVEVLEPLRDRVTEIELELGRFEEWGTKVLDVLDQAIRGNPPGELHDVLQHLADDLRHTKPHRRIVPDPPIIHHARRRAWGRKSDHIDKKD